MHVRLMNRIYNTVFLFIVTITILFINVSMSQLTSSFPSLMLNTSMTISTPIQTYGNVKQMKIQGGFIFRLSMSGKLMIWSAKNRTLLYQLFDGQSQYPLQKCVKFSLGGNNETLVIYTMTQKVFVLNIKISGSNITTISSFTPQYNISNSTTYTFRNIEIINDTQLVIFLSLSQVKSLIKRFTLTGNSVGQQNKIVSANIQFLYEMKTCQIGYLINNGSFVYYVVVWKDDCYFQLQRCIVGGQCVVEREYQSANCTQADLASNLTTNFKLQFTPGCSAIIFSQKFQGYGVYNISQQQFSTFFSNTINVELSSLNALSTYGYGMIFHFTINGVFFINLYEPSIQENAVNLTLPQYGQKSAINLDDSYFLTANSTQMIFYNFYCQNNTLTLIPSSYLCLPCPRYCSNCDLNGKCIQCRVNYTLYQASNSCVLTSNNVTNNNSNSNQTNSTVIDGTNNNSTLQNDTTITVPDNNNQQQQPTANTTTTTNNLTIQPKYTFQSTITNLIQSQSAQTVINASVFSLSMLQLFPFSFLFMRFINFWSICSYYLFLRVKMPTYLYDILYSIYQGINTSIFSSLGVDMNVYLTHQEKVDQWMSQQFGVSNDFISANIQNFVLLIISYIVLWLLYILREKLDKTNILRRALQKIDLPFALIGQYVAIMNGFFLIMPVIQLHSSQSTFSQKVNLTLHITFILISLIIVGFALSYVHQQCTRLNTKSQKEIYIFVDGQLLRQWVINCLSNSLLPGFAVFGSNILYLVFNSGLFIFFLYAGMKVKQFKLNSIILALELIIFHIAFIVMTIFDSQSHPLTYHSSAACLVVIIFLGAAHELASFIMSIVYAIYCCIKKSLNSVTNIQSSIVIEGITVEKPEQQNDVNVFNQQSQSLESKSKRYNLMKLKNVSITQLPKQKLRVQSLNQTNAETAKSIFKKQHQWTKKSSNKSKKAVRFDIDEMKNHYHFQKVLTSKPQSLNSPQQSDVSNVVKKRRKPYFTKYKSTKQLKGLKVEQTQSKNQSIPNIHLNQQHQKTDLPITKAKNLSLYGMKNMKWIQNIKNSLTPSQSQRQKSSVYVSTKSIKNNFKIEVFNVDDKQLQK